ncbi:MAG TPA: hypothetical protein PLX56_12910, partial [bacterium]|nr:hypothetical protein [bacterium]
MEGRINSLTKSISLVIIAIVFSAFTGCWDDSNKATGELGVLKYYLTTKYDADGNLKIFRCYAVNRNYKC